jgi:hypothetical protein
MAAVYYSSLSAIVFCLRRVSQRGTCVRVPFKNTLRAHSAGSLSGEPAGTKIISPVEGRPPLDIIVLDLKNFDEFDPSIRPQIMDHINDPSRPYASLVNSDQFIIIN